MQEEQLTKKKRKANMRELMGDENYEMDEELMHSSVIRDKKLSSKSINTNPIS